MRQANFNLIFLFFCVPQFDSREDIPAVQVDDYEDEFDDRATLLPADATARLERMPLYAQHSTLLYYKLDEKFELGEMASLFFNDLGRVIFYLSISIYLYGDLSIYSAAVAKTLRDLFW